MLLDGKVALVTGGAAGIGRAIAEAYARAGAAVMVTDIDGDGAAGVAAAITQAGGQVASAVLDTTSPDDHQRVVTEVEKRFGALHLAANNAGVTIPATPTAELSLEDWAKVRSVDLDGVFYGVRAQIPALLRAGGGVIVTTSSIAGKRGLQGMAPYAAAKHGVIGLMETIAWEYGPRHPSPLRRPGLHQDRTGGQHP